MQDGRAIFLPQPKIKLMRSFYVSFGLCSVMLISQTTKIGQVLCFKMAVIQIGPVPVRRGYRGSAQVLTKVLSAHKHIIQVEGPSRTPDSI